MLKKFWKKNKTKLSIFILALATTTFVAHFAIKFLSHANEKMASRSIANLNPFDSLNTPPTEKRHAIFIHLDGIIPEVFEKLKESNQLPHLNFLLEHGKYSNKTSTVDKSETMKVIQSYYTSKRETEVVGWWQFNRDNLRFVNYDTHPVGLFDYILGLTFPKYPTLYDITNDKGDNTVAGFTLTRRGVAFQNYSRAYYEGIQGAFQHKYFKQNYASVDGFLKVIERIAKNKNEKLPKLMTALLAPADEMAHWHGVVATDNDNSGFYQRLETDGNRIDDEYCLARLNQEKDVYEPFFKLFDHAKDNVDSIVTDGLENTYFTHTIYNTSKTKLQKVCFKVPLINTYAHSSNSSASDIGEQTTERLAPSIVVAMIMIDVQIGKIINTLRSIRPDENNNRYNPAWGNGLNNYIKTNKTENSLFERTLFLVMGDHGFADTKHGMAKKEKASPYFHQDSINKTFIQYMNEELGLNTITENAEKTAPLNEQLIGVDDQEQPSIFAFLHNDPSWQSEIIKAKVKEATNWANNFFEDLKFAVKDEMHKKYWYLVFLKKMIIDPKVDEKADPYRSIAMNFLIHLYLKADSDYVVAEDKAMRAIYEKNVRLVYGGAARSNAEIFIPTINQQTGTASWRTRPTFDQIINYRPGATNKSLMEAFERNPGIGLIFIRKNNSEFNSEKELPKQMEVKVFDRFNNSGTITVVTNEKNGLRLYHYKKDDDSNNDPLNIEKFSADKGTVGTFDDWNQWSIENNFYYHNVVAGIGDYLYSTNSAIGDVLLMRSQGWNFFDNGGSHGGVHRDEKLTIMIASAPGITQGELLSKYFYSYDGKNFVTKTSGYPTVLDMAPTVLEWLGYGGTLAYSTFAKTKFATYYDKWLKNQKTDILVNLDKIDNVNDTLKEVGFNDMRLSRFAKSLDRLFGFIPTQTPKLPSYDKYKIDGRELQLQR